MVAVPTAQGVITGVFKQKLQRRRFNVTIAKHHVGFTLMTRISPFGAAKIISQTRSPPQKKHTIHDDSIVPLKTVTDGYHSTIYPRISNPT